MPRPPRPTLFAGGIYTEAELWAVIAHLRRYAFVYPQPAKP